MQQRVMNMLGQLWSRWQALGRAKQIRFGGAAVILLLAIGAAVFFFTRPQMVVIETNMEPQQLSQALTVLQDNGITATTANNTTALSVPKESVDSARLLLATSGIRTQEITYEDALNLGMSATESTKNMINVQAKQTELQNSIKMLNNIRDAKVTLQIPNGSPFILRDQDMPSATVVLDTSGDLSSTQLEAIAYHVSKNVANLKLENISIMDTNLKSLYQTGPEGISGSMTRQQEVEAGKKHDIENQVRALFSHQYNMVDVMAQLEWDWTGSSTTKTTYTPFDAETGSGLTTWESVSESAYENMAEGGQPGVQSNNTQTPQYPTGTGENQTASSTAAEREYLVDSEITQMENPGTGRWSPSDSSIAVVLFINRVYREDDLAQRIENGEIPQQTWEDFKTNTLISPVALDMSSGEALNRIRSATGIQNVVVDGYEMPVFVDSVRVVRPINQYLMAGLLLLLIALLAFGLIRRTQPVEITEIEPELSVEELLVSSAAQEPKTEEVVPEIDYFAESELKRQIDKFVDEKPEAAAQLLRNWLSEEWE